MASDVDVERAARLAQVLRQFVGTNVDERALSRPPFRLIHSIATLVTERSGFGAGLFLDDELDGNVVRDKGRDAKLLWLRKLIALVAVCTRAEVVAKPNKIIAGTEVAQTHELLELLVKAAKSKPVEHDVLVQRIVDATRDEWERVWGKPQPTPAASKPAAPAVSSTRPLTPPRAAAPPTTAADSTVSAPSTTASASSESTSSGPYWKRRPTTANASSSSSGGSSGRPSTAGDGVDRVRVVDAARARALLGLLEEPPRAESKETDVEVEVQAAAAPPVALRPRTPPRATVAATATAGAGAASHLDRVYADAGVARPTSSTSNTSNGDGDGDGDTFSRASTASAGGRATTHTRAPTTTAAASSSSLSSSSSSLARPLTASLLRPTTASVRHGNVLLDGPSLAIAASTATREEAVLNILRGGQRSGGGGSGSGASSSGGGGGGGGGAAGGGEEEGGELLATAADKGDLHGLLRLCLPLAAVQRLPPDAHARVLQELQIEEDRSEVRTLHARTAAALSAAGLPDAAPSALFAAAADVDVNYPRGPAALTPLHSAAAACDFPAVLALLAAGADVKARSAEHSTPLHALCGSKTASSSAATSLAAARTALALVAAGASVNSKDEYEQTPLHAAAAGGHAVLVRALLSAGARAGARDRFEDQPLDVATKDVGVVAALKAALQRESEEAKHEDEDEEDEDGEEGSGSGSGSDAVPWRQPSGLLQLFTAAAPDAFHEAVHGAPLTPSPPVPWLYYHVASYLDLRDLAALGRCCSTAALLLACEGRALRHPADASSKLHKVVAALTALYCTDAVSAGTEARASGGGGAGVSAGRPPPALRPPRPTSSGSTASAGSADGDGSSSRPGSASARSVRGRGVLSVAGPSTAAAAAALPPRPTTAPRLAAASSHDAELRKALGYDS